MENYTQPVFYMQIGISLRIQNWFPENLPYKNRIKLAATIVMQEPIIGIKVLFTRSKGLISAIPLATTMTPVIGEIALAELATKCIGRIMNAAATPVLAAISGTRLANAKTEHCLIP